MTDTKVASNKGIEGFPGYCIDMNGDAWSCRPPNGKGPFLKKWRKLKASIHHNGYKVVTLYKEGNPHQRSLHRLVLEAFVGPCPKGMQACHNNGMKADNRPENLRWDTPKNNCVDKKRHGTWQGGEASGMAKLTEKQVRVIRWAYFYGVPQRKLAKYFSTTQANIGSIINNRSWKHKSAQITP